MHVADANDAPDFSRRPRRRAAVALGIFLALAGGVAAGTYLSCWRYASGFVLQVRPSSDRVATPVAMRTYLQAQRERLSSEVVLAMAMMKFDALAQGDNADAPWQDVTAVRAYARSHVQHLAQLRQQVHLAGGEDSLSVTVQWQEERELARRLGKGSRELAAQRTRQLARCLLEAYMMQSALAEPSGETGPEPSAESPYLQVARTECQTAQRELEQFITEQIQADLPSVERLLAASQPSRPSDLLGQQRQLDVQLAGVQATAEQVSAALSEQSQEQVSVSAEMLSADPALGKIQDAIASGRLKINSVTARFTDEKELKEAQDELAMNLAELRAELSRCQAALQEDLAAIKARRQALVKAMKDEQAQARVLAEKAARYQALGQRVEIAQTILANRLAESLAASQAAQPAAMQVVVLDPPSLPNADKPLWPRPWTTGGIAALAALVAGGISLRLGRSASHV